MDPNTTKQQNGDNAKTKKIHNPNYVWFDSTNTWIRRQPIQAQPHNPFQLGDISIIATQNLKISISNQTHSELRIV